MRSERRSELRRQETGMTVTVIPPWVGTTRVVALMSVWMHPPCRPSRDDTAYGAAGSPERKKSSMIELRFRHLKVHSARYLDFWLSCMTNVVRIPLSALMGRGGLTWGHFPAARMFAAGKPLDVHRDILRCGRVMICRLAVCELQRTA